MERSYKLNATSMQRARFATTQRKTPGNEPGVYRTANGSEQVNNETGAGPILWL